MSRLEMVRAAIGELGDGASADAIVEYVRRRFGQAVGPRFVPVYLATLRAEQEHRLARERAARIVAEEAERPPRRRRAAPPSGAPCLSCQITAAVFCHSNARRKKSPNPCPESDHRLHRSRGNRPPVPPDRVGRPRLAGRRP